MIASLYIHGPFRFGHREREREIREMERGWGRDTEGKYRHTPVLIISRFFGQLFEKDGVTILGWGFTSSPHSLSLFIAQCENGENMRRRVEDVLEHILNYNFLCLRSLYAILVII